MCDRAMMYCETRQWRYVLEINLLCCGLGSFVGKKGLFECENVVGYITIMVFFFYCPICTYIHQYTTQSMFIDCVQLFTSCSEMIPL